MLRVAQEMTQGHLRRSSGGISVQETGGTVTMPNICVCEMCRYANVIYMIYCRVHRKGHSFLNNFIFI